MVWPSISERIDSRNLQIKQILIHIRFEDTGCNLVFFRPYKDKSQKRTNTSLDRSFLFSGGTSLETWEGRDLEELTGISFLVLKTVGGVSFFFFGRSIADLDARLSSSFFILSSLSCRFSSISIAHSGQAHSPYKRFVEHESRHTSGTLARGGLKHSK